MIARSKMKLAVTKGATDGDRAKAARNVIQVAQSAGPGGELHRLRPHGQSAVRRRQHRAH